MATDTTLLVRVGLTEWAAFVSLARRCGTSQRQLGRHAIQRMLVAAKGGATLTVPPLEPAQACHGIKLWLREDMAAELHNLAASRGEEAAELGARAVRHMLAQAKAGALPMMKPPEEAPAREWTWEEIGASQNGFNPNVNPSHVNYGKAIFSVARLERLVQEGIDPQNLRAALRDIEALVTVKPA